MKIWLRPLRKLIYSVVILVYKVYSFFDFFASNFFGKGYFYGLVQISSLFLLLSLALFPIVRERDEVIK